MSDDLFEHYHATPAAPPPTGDTEKDFFAAYPLESLTKPAQSAFASAPPPPPPPADALPFQPGAPAPRTVEQVMDALNALVGLKQVKQGFMRLAQFARVQQARSANDLATLPVPIHAIFYGAPGAGKTTVAALYGQLLRALGVLPSGHLVETDRLGLATNFPAQTAERTLAALRRAAGGVLFIDDAHALYKDDYATWDAGGEIIQMLLEAMASPDLECAIVLGGYAAPMQTLVQAYDGLKNRFSNHFFFDDYSADELQTMFERLSAANHYDLTTGAKRKVGRILSEKRAEQDVSFGNARYVANLFRQVTYTQALRVGGKLETLDADGLKQVIADDVSAFVLPSPRAPRAIGFKNRKETAE